jgi:hypothetical protein
VLEVSVVVSAREVTTPRLELVDILVVEMLLKVLDAVDAATVVWGVAESVCPELGVVEVTSG